MIEILPIRLLTDEDAPIFGSLGVALGKLKRAGIPVVPGIVVTPPNLKLKTVIEQFDFGTKEVFTQSLTLVWKEINKIPIPQILRKETDVHKSGILSKRRFFLDGEKVDSLKDLWQKLLYLWFDEIKQRLWNNGFYTGITEGLESKIVGFIKKTDAFGSSYFDDFTEEVVIHTKFGKVRADDLKKISELVKGANKKLFIPYEYEWIVDRGVKLAGLKPYTALSHPPLGWDSLTPSVCKVRPYEAKQQRSALKVFFDLSSGITIEKNIDGVYIASEKIFDLNKPNDSFEQLVFKIVESAKAFPDSPILVKLADKSEGFGRVRGALRLIHQKSLFDPIADALDFARHKKQLTNVHVVVPFVRKVTELLQIKRDLATKKLMRKNSLQIWAELAVPENIINIEEYLVAGIDGVVLNLDELLAHLNGFDPGEAEVAFYKNEAEGLIKFLEDGIKLMHKSKIPVISYGSLAFYPKVLEFLVEKGVYGLVAERYEAHSAYSLLNQVERRLILRKTS